MNRPVIVGPVEGGSARVDTRIDDAGVWFESADGALDTSAEAAGSAVLLPAVRRRRRLRIIGQPVSAVWRTNVVRLMEVWREWWGYPVLEPHVDVRTEVRPRADGTVLCFTGGLDSFYSLLRGERLPDALAFVQGYDIPLGDRVRQAAWDAALTRVAAATGTRAIRLRSNVRTHPLVARSQWDRAHGGALAAIGHLLSSAAGTLVIASSAPVRYGHAWGSHESTDRFWSSDRLLVVHHGASQSRIEKLQAIGGERLVQQHLRVCWENRVPAGNCSTCDKCVSTMVMIAACADPSRFDTFDWSVPVERRLDRLRSTRFVRTYGELLHLPLPATLATAIQSLLRRNLLPGRVRALWHDWRG